MTSQTEAARADLRIARQYFEQWEKEAAGRSYRETKEDLSSEVSGYLDWALSYIKQARQKDPAVTLEFKIAGAHNPELRGKVGLTTPDALEADILLIKTVGFAREGESPEVLRAAISKLKRSITLQPLLSEAHVRLAYAYAYNHEPEKALSVLHNAIQKFPDDFRVRSTMDHLRSGPEFRPPPPADEPTKSSGGISLSFLSFGFLLLAVSLTTLAIFGTTSLEKTAIGGVMVLFGVVSFLVAGTIIYFGIKWKIQDAREAFGGKRRALDASLAETARELERQRQHAEMLRSGKS